MVLQHLVYSLSQLLLEVVLVTFAVLGLTVEPRNKNNITGRKFAVCLAGTVPPFPLLALLLPAALAGNETEAAKNNPANVTDIAFFIEPPIKHVVI